MTFEFSTADDIGKVVERIQADSLALHEIRVRLAPQMHEEITIERILITETADRVQKLAVSVATLAEVLVNYLGDEAQHRDISGGD